MVSAAFVMVMDPADMRHLDDRAAGWRLYRPCDRRILVRGETRPPLVIIGQAELEGASEGSLVPQLLDQRADVGGDWRAIEPGSRGTPTPVPGEEAAMPRDDSSRLHDLHGLPPAAPDA